MENIDNDNLFSHEIIRITSFAIKNIIGVKTYEGAFHKIIKGKPQNKIYVDLVLDYIWINPARMRTLLFAHLKCKESPLYKDRMPTDIFKCICKFSRVNYADPPDYPPTFNKPQGLFCMEHFITEHRPYYEWAQYIFFVLRKWKCGLVDPQDDTEFLVEIPQWMHDIRMTPRSEKRRKIDLED